MKKVFQINIGIIAILVAVIITKSQSPKAELASLALKDFIPKTPASESTQQKVQKGQQIESFSMLSSQKEKQSVAKITANPEVKRDLIEENKQLPGVLIRELLSSDESLHQFKTLTQVALRNSLQQQQLEALLSDRGFIENQMQHILKVEDKAYSLKATLKRVLALEVLSKAADWSQNPLHSEIYFKILKIFDQPITWGDFDIDTRKAMTQDRVELYHLVAKSYPQRLNEFVDRYRSGPYARFLAWVIEGRNISKEGANT